jgi:L-ascorbate metabolism protein UlaG (beta-lactamase superfamily)
MHRSIPVLFAALLVSGCFHRHSRTENAGSTGPRQATVEWLGRGSFLVSSSIGLSVLLDPFNPGVAHIPVKVASIPADVVFITHEDEMANFTDLAAGSPQIFRSSMATGVNRASGILVRGVRTSSENLAATGRLNVAYVFAMDGVRFCDLGAIEDAITPSEALNIGTVDVLFIPVGGPPNFTDAKRLATIDRLRPKIVVPWPYGGSFERIPGQMNVVRLNSIRFTVSPSALPATTTVYILSGH